MVYEAPVYMWVASKHVNTIKRKPLKTVDVNRIAISGTCKAHSTWKAAHDWMVHERQAEVVRIKRELRRAEDQLKRAMAMTEPPPRES